MINLLLNILSYQNSDKKLWFIFLTCVMVCTIMLWNFNLKLHLCMEKWKTQIVLGGNLNQRGKEHSLGGWNEPNNSLGATGFLLDYTV